MAEPILYVRNRRPNAVLIKFENLKYPVERRGSRQDTVALPPEAREDPVVSQFLNKGIVEEISKEQFMALGGRPENPVAGEKDKQERLHDYPLDRTRANEAAIPMEPEETSRTPYIITDKDLRSSMEFRTPAPRFAVDFPSTDEEIQQIEERRRVAEEAALAELRTSNLEQNKVEGLEQRVSELSDLVRTLLARDAAREEEVKKAKASKPKAKATRKASTTKNKRVRAKSSSDVEA